jgi:hypothetical protein
MAGCEATLHVFLREYLFVSLFRACIEDERERQPLGGDAAG